MKMIKLVLTGWLVTLLLIPQAVSAANIAKAFTLSPQIGGYMFEGNQSGDLDDATVYSIALGYNYNQNLGVELGYRYLGTENSSEQNTSINAGQVDVLYHLFPKNDFVPFAIAGVGLSHSNAAQDDDIITEYGLGFKYFLSDNFALRADAKHIQNWNNSDDDDDSNLYNNFSYTFGFTIQNDKW